MSPVDFFIKSLACNVPLSNLRIILAITYIECYFR
jgi:hypothetical protein